MLHAAVIYIYIYTVTLEFNGKFKRFYEYIYLYIGDSCRLRLSCEWTSYPGVFGPFFIKSQSFDD